MLSYTEETKVITIPFISEYTQKYEELSVGRHKMEITSKLLKPITETPYLNAENVKRYRVILRFFSYNMSELNIGWSIYMMEKYNIEVGMEDLHEEKKKCF